MLKKFIEFKPFKPCTNCHANKHEHINDKCIWGPNTYKSADIHELITDWYQQVYYEWECPDVES